MFLRGHRKNGGMKWVKVISNVSIGRSNRPEVFFGEGVLKKCGEFTGEHPCRSVISPKLLNQLY